MQHRRLACRLGWHRPITVVAVRHMVRTSSQHTGSLVTYRCERCGRISRRVSDRYLWRLEDILRR